MKSVGIISFFPAFSPPRSGGELRLYHMAMHLARNDFDVRMVSPTYGDAAEETIEHHPHFHERRCPKTRLYNSAHRFFDKVAGFRECSGLVCSVVGRRHASLREEAERLAKSSDILTHESPFLAPLAPRRSRSRQLLVYNSYNNESRMARDMFGNSMAGRLARRRITGLERALVRESDLVFACSRQDATTFAEDYRVDRSKIVLVPNGVDPHAIQPCPGTAARLAARSRLELSATRPACFFIGSPHPPNIEAVDIIIHRLAASTPEADFLIAGKVCDAFAGRALPTNIRLLGLIDEETKLALLHGADVALNPVISGSGTNLKMLEYFAAGLPVLTTPVGARGLDIEPRQHALVVEPDGLADALVELLGDATLAALLGRSARQLVEQQFSWEAIGSTVADVYTLKTTRRILILNDYPVYPPEGGGQVRVDAVARGLEAAGMGVSILSLTRQPEGRRVEVSGRLEELNVPRSFLHRQMDAIVSRITGCGADDVTAMLFTKWLSRDYGRALRREVAHADAVMLSHPYLEPVARRLPPHVTLYYDSHNTEYHLKRSLYRQGALPRWLIEQVRRAEQASCRRAKAVFCVSRENADQLEHLLPGLARKAFVTPNGVDCLGRQVLSAEERRRLRRSVGFGREFVAIFLGSGHPPNAEAARLIIEKISREHPRVLFLLVGSVSGWFWNMQMPGNILLMGMVRQDVKDFLLQTSDFALNPMLTGSGTSLKLFDYMASGLPVLTTAVGARGLEGEAREAVVLLEPDQFGRELRRLLGDPRRCEELGRRSREAAERTFDWSVALAPMQEIIAGRRAVPQREPETGVVVTTESPV